MLRLSQSYHNAMLEKGLVQVYTGDGKGKTTAALGLALRAAGRGLRVRIVQFLKPASLDLGERRAIDTSGLSIEIQAVAGQSGVGLDQSWSGQARLEIGQALAKLVDPVAQRAFDVLILDELAFCLARGLADLGQVKGLIDARDPHVEIVITGRDAPDELLAMADLVTRMENHKHPFDSGLKARAGIEY